MIQYYVLRTLYFNPRTPYRDATMQLLAVTPLQHYFNPRTPYRDATEYLAENKDLIVISIHAPRIGMRRWERISEIDR